MGSDCPIGHKDLIEWESRYIVPPRTIGKMLKCPIAFVNGRCQRCGRIYEGHPTPSFTLCHNQWFICGKCYFNLHCPEMIDESTPENREAKVGQVIWVDV